MRTVPTSESAVWQKLHRSVHVRVYVSDERGLEVCLSDLYGRDWVLGVEWGDTTDQPIGQATVRLVRQQGADNLSPDAGGRLNRDANGAAQALLAEDRKIRIETQIRPEGSEFDATAGTFQAFEGYIDEIDLGSDDKNEITLSCRDITAVQQNAFIEDEEPPPTGVADWYTALTWGMTVESYLQALSDATMMAVHAPLWHPDADHLTTGLLGRPTQRNGYVFMVQTAGTSGSTEPSWDKTPGNTTNDGTVVWQCCGKLGTPAAWTAAHAYVASNLLIPTTRNGFFYLCVISGTSHATTQPTWPTDLGATVNDGTVTWRCVGILPDIWTPTSPGWHLNQPKPENGVKKEPLLDAMQKQMQAIGWNLRADYRTAQARWVPKIYKPKQDYTDPTVSLPATHYRIEKVTKSGALVRDVVRVTYADRSAGYKRKAVTSVDPAILSGTSMIGHRIRFSESCEEAAKGIDSGTEAQALADIIRNDRSIPTYDVQVSVPFIPYFSLLDGDSIELNPPDDPFATRFFANSKVFALVGVKHSIGGGAARTTLTLKDVAVSTGVQPASMGYRQLAREARPGVAPFPSMNQPGACRVLAYRDASTQQIAAGGTITKITLDGLDTDKHGDWDGTNTFTAPLAGLYQITGQVSFPTVVAGTILGVRAAGAVAEVTVSKAGEVYRPSVTTVRQLVAGDTVYLEAYQNTAAAVTPNAGSTSTFLTVTRIG